MYNYRNETAEKEYINNELAIQNHKETVLKILVFYV